MYLMRLIYLCLQKNLDLESKTEFISSKDKSIKNESKNDTISQIKNITQEKKTKPQSDTEIKAEKKIIDSFNQLLEICVEKKEVKLKYELEKNVNLVKFERNKIEISFNDNLDKSFIKEISSKLFEWTGERWLILFSKKKGGISKKQRENDEKNEIIKNLKNSKLFDLLKNNFPDAYLDDVKIDKDGKD